MPSLRKTAARIERCLERAILICAAVALGAIVVLTGCDVIGRYLFSRPIVGAGEITEILLVITVFGAFPTLAARAGHLRVDVLEAVMGPKCCTVLETLADIVIGLALLALSYALFVKAADIADFDGMTQTIGIRLAPVAYFLAVVMAASGVLHLMHAIWRPAGSAQRLEGVE